MGAVGEVDIDVLAGPPCGRLEAGNLERQVHDIGSQLPDSLDHRRVPRRLDDGREHALGADHERTQGPRLAHQCETLLGLRRAQRHRRFLIADRAFDEPDAAGAAGAERAVVAQAHALTRRSVEYGLSVAGLEHCAGFMHLDAKAHTRPATS